MKKIFYWIIVAIFLVSCSSKKYFEPEEIKAKVEFDGKLPAKIIDVGRSGATLEDGSIITSKGVLNRLLPQGYYFIGGGDGLFVGAKECGSLIIINKDKKSVFKKEFRLKMPLSASVKGNYAAIVFSNNEIAVYDIKSKRRVFKKRLKNVYAIDSKVAMPFFLDSLILFPTLDGKIEVVETSTMEAIRSIIVGQKEEFLNNIIFLNVIEDRLIAATQNRVVSVTPRKVNSLNLDICDIIFLKKRVYILTKDGRILLCDKDLNVLKSRKYPFAHFVGLIYGEYLYAIEKGGYIIATDRDLMVSNIFELPSKIDDYLFISKDSLYFKDSFFKLNVR
jgi:hypothetical protein